MKRFEGRTALVTGGTTGIGFATARLLLSEGGRVAVTGTNPATLAVARQELGHGVEVIASDAARLADVDALAAQVGRALGHLDLLFVNAGVARFVPFDQVSEAQYDETMAINLRGAFFTVQRLAPLLRQGSSVVFTTSVADEKGVPAASVYSASKAGLRSLARTLSAELLPRGIRVNAVSPGPVETPIFGKSGLTPEQAQGFARQMKEGNPMRRFGTAGEVAQAVLYLAAEATYTTGAELTVDGGLAHL